MASKRCSICAINYPTNAGLGSCPKCSGELEWMYDAPDSDWREASAPVDESTAFRTKEEENVHRWRVSELIRAGYDIAIAGGLAEMPHVDIRRAESLLKRGCPDRLAAEILR